MMLDSDLDSDLSYDHPGNPIRVYSFLKGSEDVYLENSNVGIKLKGCRKVFRVYQPRGELTKVKGPDDDDNLPLRYTYEGTTAATESRKVKDGQSRRKLLKEVTNHGHGLQRRQVKPRGKGRKQLQANQHQVEMQTPGLGKHQPKDVWAKQQQVEMQKKVVVKKLRGLQLKEFRANYQIVRTLYDVWLQGDPEDHSRAKSVYLSVLSEAKIDWSEAEPRYKEEENAFLAHLTDEELVWVLDLEGVKSAEPILSRSTMFF